MTRKLQTRAHTEEKLTKRFSNAISNFDEAHCEIEWVIRDVSRYDEIVQSFPYSVIGFIRYKGEKQGIQIRLTNTIKDVSKSLDDSVYREAMLRLNRKFEIKGSWFDTYISVSEWN